MSPNGFPFWANGFYTEEMEGEHLLYRIGADKAYHLNETASLIWQLCDGTRTVDQVVALLSAEYPESAQNLQGDIVATIAQLQHEGALIELHAPRASSS